LEISNRGMEAHIDGIVSIIAYLITMRAYSLWPITEYNLNNLDSKIC
jgi:hypothetical protein